MDLYLDALFVCVPLQNPYQLAIGTRFSADAKSIFICRSVEITILNIRYVYAISKIALG